MFKTALLAILSLTLTDLARGLTDAGTEALKQLTVAIQQEAKDRPGGDRSGGSDAQYVRMLKQAVASGDESGIQQALSQISSYYHSEAVTGWVDKLSADTAVAKEEREAAVLREIDSLLARATETALKASKAEELDDIIVELGKLNSDRYSESRKIQMAYQRIEPAKRMILAWQNYLFAKNIGNSRDAIQALTQLSSSDSSSQATLIPRSQILARIEQERGVKSSAEEILNSIKSLDQMAAAITELRKFEQNDRQSGNSSVAAGCIQSLMPLEKSYREFQAGLPTSIDVSQQSYDSSQPKPGLETLTMLKSQLLVLLLPRYVGAPDGTKAKADENVVQFIDRMTAEAKGRGDFATGARLRQVRQILYKSTYTADDSAGLKAFVGGQSQEAAGQYAQAVTSYQNALKSGSDLIPAKLVGERLAAIKTEHPKEYEDGMQQFTDPPPSRYASDRDEMFRMMRMRPGYPGDMQDPRNPAPTLLIPPVAVPTAPVPASPPPVAAPTK